jgi:hypothetical protein
VKSADDVRTPRVPSHPPTQRGRWRFFRHYLEMAVTMSAGMVAWMRHRRHRWASTLEMAGAMVAPAVALTPLLRLGLLAGDSLLMVEHVVMLPLMFLVMLRRRAEYGGSADG